MAGESPFEKKFVEESSKADLSGVLDQLNLPPAFREYVRVHQKTIKIAAIIVAVIVVAWSLYDGYHTSQLEKSSAALYNGLQVSGDDQVQALKKVTTDYSGTPASTWAEIELAHAAMKKGDYVGAVAGYNAVRARVSQSGSLYPLLTYGIAQALETQKQFSEALIEYQTLKGIDGYLLVGTLGMAGIHEEKGEKQEALAVYEQCLSTFTGVEQNSPDKILIEEKIARLKALP